MDYEETLEWLKSYKDKYYRLEFINNQLLNMKSPSYTENISTSNPKDRHDYIDEKTKIVTEMEKIEDAIDDVTNERERYVLAYRFLHFKRLEDIAYIMHYHINSIKKYYGDGIKNVRKCL